MSIFYTTPEEHTRAVMEALDETGKITQTKEGARAFLIRAGIIKEGNPEPKSKSKIKKSK